MAKVDFALRYLEDGGDVFLRNVSKSYSHVQRHNPENHNQHSKSR
jgi:hypothetical protein